MGNQYLGGLYNFSVFLANLHWFTTCLKSHFLLHQKSSYKRKPCGILQQKCLAFSNFSKKKIVLRHIWTSQREHYGSLKYLIRSLIRPYREDFFWKYIAVPVRLLVGLVIREIRVIHLETSEIFVQLENS